MSGASIAAEVDAALASLAPELGSGAFSIVLVRLPKQRTSPSDTNYYGEPSEFELNANVQMYPRRMIDGTLIMQGDRRVMVSATGERPLTSDTLRLDGDEYRIIEVDEVAPQGVPLYYVVQARK